MVGYSMFVQSLTISSWGKLLPELGSLSCQWAAYHASRQLPELRKVCNITLLPLFTEHANTPAMICHSMKVLKRATEYLNPGQTPVLTVDQPLCALAKMIQWEIGGDLAEDRFVAMLAPFHAEDKSLKVVGQFLDESGWLSPLVQ